MIIVVDQAAKVTVKDPENFRAFSMLVLAKPNDLDRVAGIIGPAVRFDDQSHAWIEAAAVVDWANRKSDVEWRRSFDRMIDFARQHGWIQDEPLRIRAHLDFEPDSHGRAS